MFNYIVPRCFISLAMGVAHRIRSDHIRSSIIHCQLSIIIAFPKRVIIKPLFGVAFHNFFERFGIIR